MNTVRRIQGRAIGDEEVAFVCRLIAEHPEWGKDPRFVTLAARLAHQEALDALIRDWTKTRGD